MRIVPKSEMVLFVFSGVTRLPKLVDIRKFMWSRASESVSWMTSRHGRGVSM
jgi:hypothetical protein